MSEEWDLGDLPPREVRIKYRGKRYVLREASGGAGICFRNASMRGAQLLSDPEQQEDGTTKRVILGDGLNDSEVVLIANCLYHADADGKLVLLPNGLPDFGSLVSEEEIRSWSIEVQDKLYDRIVEMSPGLRRNASPEKNAETGSERNGQHEAMTTSSATATS